MDKEKYCEETSRKLLKKIGQISIETDRDNANVGNNYGAKMLRIGSEASKWSVLYRMPEKLAQEHINMSVYDHDLDSFMLTTNCLHIPLGRLLKEGFNTGYGMINPPKRIESAAALACIIIQSSQNDLFGGQSFANFDNDLAPYAAMSAKEIVDELKPYFKNQDALNEVCKAKLYKAVRQAMQSIVYNLNSMHSRSGSQIVFSSVNLGLPESKEAALIDQIFLEEYEKGLGRGEQPIFPNIIFRVKAGVNREPEDPYYYLFQLACRVASKRMNPTFMNMDADFNLMYYQQGIIPATMGCRTYVMKNINGEDGAEGRGNIAPATINLPRIALEVKRDNPQGDMCDEKYNALIVDEFFKKFNERINIAREKLMYRYDVLKNLKVEDLPFVIGQHLMKGSENLKRGDSIEPVLKQGTYAIGFIGLAEALIALTGFHHGENIYAEKLGYSIIKYLRDKCDEFCIKDKLNWSCYATPAEGLSGKMIKKDKELFGIVPGVTDKDYYTNSFHIPVYYKIGIQDKIKIEAPYHKLCNAGHISYIEFDSYPTPEIVEKIIRYAYTNTNISYVGINFHIRYCKDCGTYLNDEDECPNCGSKNIQGISRVTGYLSLDERFGAGKVAERADRISHNGLTGKHYKL